jgi:asparagine synthase (glutamine-hydrolysing)
MCGIAGYFGTQTIPAERIDACFARMRRRGPDATGFYQHRHASGRNVFLLHSRLNIIDLNDRANQPFEQGAARLCFNGEIYNYRELKLELQSRGHSFHTESDTEVLAASLGVWGPQALDACEGMWAFAWYDETQGSLLLSRDRFGEKPLYVYRDATGLYFGSEVKFLFALLGGSLPIHFDHVYRYLVNGYKALYKQPRFFFEKLSEVPAGSMLTLDSEGRESSARYWQPQFRPDDSLTYDDCVRSARAALIRSVELRLRADVPLAFCMSGGIDSNGIIAIAKRTLGYDVEGFTIVNTDARYDERDIVEQSARELGIRHHAVPVTTTGFLPRLRELVRYHDSPVCTITYYAQWLLMKAIHDKGYRISVSGTAADELFSGYYDHHLFYLCQMRSDPAQFELSLRNWRKHIEPLVRNPYLRQPELYFKNPDLREHIFLDADRFAAFLTHPWHEPFAETHYLDDVLRNRMWNEMFHEAVPVILHEDDLNAMYYSIENRSPYLDRKLFDVCQTFPTRHLVRGGFAKAILRDAVRGIAPDVVLDSHRKVGFNAPILSFLDVHDPAVRAEVLGDSPIYEHVRRDRIEDLMDKADLPNSQSKFLFYFLAAKMFLEEFGA